MTIEIRELDASQREEWDGYVARSPDAGLFHQYHALTVQATYSDAVLHPLVGFNGNEPIGLFPIFEVEKGPFKAAFSPPPDIRVTYLGPAMLDMGCMKARKAEQLRTEFIEGCREWVELSFNPHYTHIRTNGSYDDMRPFLWEGCDAEPKYTYLVDIQPDEDDLLMSFSRNARRNIRDGRKLASNITVGGVDEIRNIVEQVKARYEEQDEFFGIPSNFVVDLYEGLPEGQIKPYVFRDGDEFVGGIIALEYGDRVYRWQGGVKTENDVDGQINDNLDWRVMMDAKANGKSWYDLVGANNPRLNGYKSKFNPTLEMHYQIEHGSRLAKTVAHVYKHTLTPLVSPSRSSRRPPPVAVMEALYKRFH
ncbi:lipid II:glycine glycyltransferase FemX [Haloferax sp. DFSO60]|uniref:lipid II:glycine glycyltransferase FemX n=1 Tax=Haloferax sp. DFSO60 TaxID=3388652 RepID=UPI00397E6F85